MNKLKNKWFAFQQCFSFHALLYLFSFSLSVILNLILALFSPDWDLSTSEFQGGKKHFEVDICTSPRTHKQRAHHQRSHYVVDSPSPCRQCYLPSVSEWGEAGNECDVCRGAFWVICLIQGLMGSEGIERLKWRVSLPSPALRLFPANMSRSRSGSCHLIFFLSGLDFQIRSTGHRCCGSSGMFPYSRENRGVPPGAASHLWPSAPSLAHSDPWTLYMKP